MKSRIGLYCALLAAILLFVGCASVEKKDAVPAESSRSEDLTAKEPRPDSQSALPPSSTVTNTQSVLSPSVTKPIPAPETQKPEKPTVTYLITTKNGCNVRSEANGKSKVITNLKRGQKLQKLDQFEDWYNIMLPSGKKGWIHKDLVKNVD